MAGKMMGSTGSGSFSDYSNESTDDDKCEKAFSVKLQDIEHCEYFKTHGMLPPIGAKISIAVEKRVVAKTETGEIVGNLPTSFNYLAGCLKQGYTYTGLVRESKATAPASLVGVDFAAAPPK